MLLGGAHLLVCPEVSLDFGVPFALPGTWLCREVGEGLGRMKEVPHPTPGMR